jgi:4'-phosphopantetheinyl transferase
MLTIAAGQTDIWACFYHEIRDEALLNRYRALSTEAERQKELRFRFAKDQRCYIVTRALLRTVLSRYAAVEPGRWSFEFNAYGKPEISSRYTAEERIAFNLSHTDGLILLGITAGSTIGIDTENIRTRQPLTGIADNFFAEEEVAALRQLAVKDQPERFFQYWTLKEAYIKARGMGLSIPLSQFSFHFPTEGEIDISFLPRLNDDSSSWRFQQFFPSPDHLAAICTKREERIHVNTKTMIRKVVPLHGDEIIDCPIVRESI